jgi:hypothetical protein
MKIFITAIIVGLIPILSYHGISFAAETQKVCVDKLTNDGKKVLDKQGKPVQECKEMKVHKKLEGTKVPEKSDKK